MPQPSDPAASVEHENETLPVVPLDERQLELLRRLDDPVFGTITRAVHPMADMAVREIRAHRKRTEAWWRSLAFEERLALMALCCRGCGALDPGCQCENDE